MWKVYDNDDAAVDTTTDNGQIVIRKAHLSLWLRWDKNQKTFLFMTYIEKALCLEVAAPGHTVGYKNIDYLLNNDRYISKFVI